MHHLGPGGGGEGGRGGGRNKWKKVCRLKSQKKKFGENVGRKYSLLSKLKKNMLTRKTINW